MKKSVCVVLFNLEGKVLAVSRKDNHNDLGLIGGKVEENDKDVFETAARETIEETGLILTDAKIEDIRPYGDYLVYLFTGGYKGELSTNEPHLVKWVDFNELFNGTFGEYNKQIYKDYFS